MPSPEEAIAAVDAAELLARGESVSASARLLADTVSGGRAVADATVEHALPEVHLGADATALDQISHSRWLTLDSQPYGYSLHVTASPEGDPIFRMVYGNGTTEAQRFSLADRTWAPVNDASLPSAEAALPGGLKNQQWLSLTGDRFGVQATQYSNNGPFFIVSDSSGNELTRKVGDTVTRNWNYLDH